MKTISSILMILFLSFFPDENYKNMKIVEYSVEELKDQKLFAIIDSINTINPNYTGYQILVYHYIYESNLEQIHYFPNYNTINKLEEGGISKSKVDNFNLLCDSLEKEYNKMVFERMCFVEDGSAEYIVLINNQKIVACFISDGFTWNVLSDDKRLKSFYELYPKLIEIGKQMDHN